MTQLDLITRRYDNVLIALPTLKKHQRRNKDGSIIHIPDPEQGDNWTSLENELHQWQAELGHSKVKETKKYCEGRIIELKIDHKKRI